MQINTTKKIIPCYDCLRWLCFNFWSKGSGKGASLKSRYPYDYTVVRFYLPWQWADSSLQLLIQPWICTPGTHYSLVDRGCVEYEICPSVLHVTSTGNQTPDLLILSPTPYPPDHMLCYLIILYHIVITISQYLLVGLLAICLFILLYLFFFTIIWNYI